MHIEELSLVAVAGLVLVVAIAMLAGRIGIATPLVLVVAGIGIGYLPGVPLIEIDPEIILLGVLPPLLYAAAVNVPILDLKRNVGPITALSVVLVIISALIIGALLHLVVPSIPFAAAVALGARIIEKHLTVDRAMEGNDHKVSLLPAEFAAMVAQIREVEAALGTTAPREVSTGEMMNRVNLAKSLVATRRIEPAQGRQRRGGPPDRRGRAAHRAALLAGTAYP